MTMFAVPNTSTKEDRPHAEPTDGGETGSHAVAGHGRCLAGAATRSHHQRTEFSGTTRAAGRSTMELAREPGTGAKTESGQTARTSLRGGHRLPGCAWPGQGRHAGSGKQLRL